MKETYFEVKENTSTHSKEFPFVIVQMYRTVFYEDVVNPNKYVHRNTAIVETKDIADKLCKIFNEMPFTTEFYKGKHERYITKTKSNSRHDIEIYSHTDSLVRDDRDFYNGTDQSMAMMQMLRNTSGSYSKSSSKSKVICRFWDRRYVPIVLNKWSHLHNEPFFLD